MKLTKEDYHRMGVPVGVGMPDHEPTPEERIQEEIENKQDEDMGKMMALQDSGDGYIQRLPPGDKARIVQFINTNTPYKTRWVKDPTTGEEKLVITEGEIPPELFHAFYGWLAHNASMSNFDERELAIEEMNLEIQEMEVVMAMPRSHYTPEMNASVRNAVHLGKLRLFQNKDGGERYLSAAEIQEDLRAFKVLRSKQPGRIANAYNAVRGRSE